MDTVVNKEKMRSLLQPRTLITSSQKEESSGEEFYSTRKINARSNGQYWIYIQYLNFKKRVGVSAEQKSHRISFKFTFPEPRSSGFG